MLEVFIWYFLGVVSYMLVSKLLNYGNTLKTYNEVIISVLQILYVVDKGTEDAFKIKYQSLKESDMPSEEIDEIHEKDKLSLDLWKELMVQSLIAMVPPKYRATVQFKNWFQAERFLENKLNQHKKDL